MKNENDRILGKIRLRVILYNWNMIFFRISAVDYLKNRLKNTFEFDLEPILKKSGVEEAQLEPPLRFFFNDYIAYQ